MQSEVVKMRVARARLYAGKTDPAGRGDLMMQDPGGGVLGHGLEGRGGHLQKREGAAGAGQVLGDRSVGGSLPIFSLLFLSL